MNGERKRELERKRERDEKEREQGAAAPCSRPGIARPWPPCPSHTAGALGAAALPSEAGAGQGWPAATPKEEDKGRVIGFWMVVMMVSYGGGGYGGFKEEKNLEMVWGDKGG